ncbi:hypothetical protein [Shinella sp. M31]|uniref:hypothetical protein n=1 Tax=Shinella sp. M31 TaxID=3368615 RepID=UPI003B9DFE9C
MTKHSFTFDVTRRITVALDDTKFTTEIMEDFNSCITDFGTDEDAYRTHAEYIAGRAIDGEDFDPREFREGYGVVREAGITVVIQDGIEFSEIAEETT